MSGYGHGNTDDRPGLNAAKLWVGGLATAIVAGLIVLVGVLIVSGVFQAPPVLLSAEAGSFGSASAGLYAVMAGVAALLATGLLHLLLISAPRPLNFFGWIMVLAIAVAVVTPFTQVGAVQSQVATAAINLVGGIAIASLLSGVGASAIRRMRRRPAYEIGRADAAAQQAGGPPYDGRHRYDPQAPERRLF